MAEQAINAGATKEEITETIRSAQYIRGVGCVYAAARTFKDLFVPGTFDLTDTVKVSRIITTPTSLHFRVVKELTISDESEDNTPPPR